MEDGFRCPSDGSFQRSSYTAPLRIEATKKTCDKQVKGVAGLRDKGIGTSPARAYKRPGRPHGPKAHDGTIKTQRVDEMWGTDMTATLTVAEGNAAIFFAIDHCSLELADIHAAKRGTRFRAAKYLCLAEKPLLALRWLEKI